jgi:3-oxoisoapionate decarboxylase
MHRRQFLSHTPAAGLAVGFTASVDANDATAQAPATPEGAHASPVRVGLDVFSVRDQGWNAHQMIDYAARQRLKHIQFSVTRFYDSMQVDHLQQIRRYAESKGITIETGMDSICPSSTRFSAADGPADQQLLAQLRTARAVGSPIVRCYLGSMADRKTEISFDQHVENMLGVLRAVRSQFVDAGVKVAIENHAGDFRAKRLRAVVEEAGIDWVGVTLDTGNPCWTMEAPLDSLEYLLPYVLTAHLRDSAVWLMPNGIGVQWVRFGQGNVQMAEVVKRLHTARPDVVLNLETICIGNRGFPVKQADFWTGYEDVTAQDLMGLWRLAEDRSPLPDPPKRSREEAVRVQLEDSDVSIAGLRAMLGELGLREA